MNRKADFLQNESIRIDSHNESNRIDLNRELECSSLQHKAAPQYMTDCCIHSSDIARRQHLPGGR